MIFFEDLISEWSQMVCMARNLYERFNFSEGELLQKNKYRVMLVPLFFLEIYKQNQII